MGRGAHRRGAIGKRWGKATADTLLPGTSPLAAVISPQMRGQGSGDAELPALKSQARAREDQMSSVRARTGKLDRGRAISLVIAVVDRDKCIACGHCQAICPTGAISIHEIADIDPMRCMGCGQCVAQCPQEAMSLQKAAIRSM